MIDKKRDRVLAVLVSVHTGDSLGAPYEEKWKPADIAADLSRRGGLCFFDYPNPWPLDGNSKTLPAGRPTDDSEQTARVVAWLLAENGHPIEVLRKSLRASAIKKESVLWRGKSTGAGSTTKDALSGDSERMQRAFANPIGTNGSLMRASPMGLWYYHELTRGTKAERTAACEHIREMSRVTHRHPHAVEACVIYASTIAALLHSPTQPHPHRAYETVVGAEAAMNCPLYIRVRSAVEDAGYLPYDPGAFPARGTAEFSLIVAYKALQETASFKKGIEYAIRVGGDTDTYAAIAGGLLGARYGLRKIPQAWREGILGKKAMLEYGRKIYQRRINPPRRGL